MERGLYAAASAMVAQQVNLDTLAQNIANANTAGYKQDVITFKSLEQLSLQRLDGNSAQGTSIGQLGTGVDLDKTYTDWSQGPVEQTNNPLDASLGQNLYFAVNTTTGERYTRAGNFNLDGQGNLLTAAGFPVLDKSGKPINVGRQINIGIDPAGNVTSAGKPIAALRIVEIAPGQLQKVGNALFTIPGGAVPVQAGTPQVVPGSLEQSNVNTVMSLVEMIAVQHNYDMAQKAITTQDSLLKQATTEVGRV